MNKQYILVGHEPVPCEDPVVWGNQFRDDKARRVAYDEDGKTSVSTVFLGIDHRHGGDGPPLLFETMIFKDGDEAYCMRYETWERAEAGHTAACLIAFGSDSDAASKMEELRESVVLDKLVDNIIEDG
jgi:hypothetical protein